MPKDVTCVTKVLDFPVLSTNFWRKTAKVLSTKKKVLCRCLNTIHKNIWWEHIPAKSRRVPWTCFVTVYTSKSIMMRFVCTYAVMPQSWNLHRCKDLVSTTYLSSFTSRYWSNTENDRFLLGHANAFFRLARFCRRASFPLSHRIHSAVRTESWLCLPLFNSVI